MAESIIQQVVAQLKDYLKINVPILREIYEEFPDPNEKVSLPSASITTLRPSYEAFPSWVHFQPATTLLHDSEIRWIVGQYIFPIQIDLWAATKKERNDLYEIVFNALHKRVYPAGLDLVMPKYHNVMAHYHVTGFTLEDTEDQAQRRERRARINMTVDVEAVVIKKEFVMEDLMVNNDGEPDINPGSGI